MVSTPRLHLSCTSKVNVYVVVVKVAYPSSESTNDRVKKFSILIMIGVVGLGGWQVSLKTPTWPSEHRGRESHWQTTDEAAVITSKVLFQTQVPHRLNHLDDMHTLDFNALPF